MSANEILIASDSISAIADIKDFAYPTFHVLLRLHQRVLYISSLWVPARRENHYPSENCSYRIK